VLGPTASSGKPHPDWVALSEAGHLNFTEKAQAIANGGAASPRKVGGGQGGKLGAAACREGEAGKRGHLICGGSRDGPLSVKTFLREELVSVVESNQAERRAPGEAPAGVLTGKEGEEITRNNCGKRAPLPVDAHAESGPIAGLLSSLGRGGINGRPRKKRTNENGQGSGDWILKWPQECMAENPKPSSKPTREDPAAKWPKAGLDSHRVGMKTLDRAFAGGFIEHTQTGKTRCEAKPTDPVSHGHQPSQDLKGMKKPTALSQVAAKSGSLNASEGVSNCLVRSGVAMSPEQEREHALLKPMGVFHINRLAQESKVKGLVSQTPTRLEETPEKKGRRSARNLPPSPELTKFHDKRSPFHLTDGLRGNRANEHSDNFYVFGGTTEVCRTPRVASMAGEPSPQDATFAPPQRRSSSADAPARRMTEGLDDYSSSRPLTARSSLCSGSVIVETPQAHRRSRGCRGSGKSGDSLRSEDSKSTSGSKSTMAMKTSSSHSCRTGGSASLSGASSYSKSTAQTSETSIKNKALERQVAKLTVALDRAKATHR